MRDLNITLIQTPLHWEDSAANRDMFSDYIASAGDTDLFILPEMFTTGFSMRSTSLAEDMSGETLQWMQSLAHKTKTAIMGSLILSENQYIYNRLIFMRPDKTFARYDKRHLFRMAGEHTNYKAGEHRLIIEYKDWRICPLICYDLRFPVWSRNRQDYDLLVYIANWPEPRRHAWRALLAARAAENIAYVAGVNRSGIDGNHLHYTGDSAVIDMTGKRLWECSAERAVETITLSAERLQEFRQRFPMHLDADDFSLHLAKTS